MMSSSLTTSRASESVVGMGDTLASSLFPFVEGTSDAFEPKIADTAVLPKLVRRWCLGTSAEESLPSGPGLLEPWLACSELRRAWSFVASEAGEL